MKLTVHHIWVLNCLKIKNLMNAWYLIRQVFDISPWFNKNNFLLHKAKSHNHT